MTTTTKTGQQADDTAPVQSVGPLPGQPRTVGDTGLNFLFLIELLTKTLFLRGQLRLFEIADHLKISIGVLEPLLTFLRTERLCEVSRSSGIDTSTAYTLTDLGRLRAEDFLQKSQYAGPAPVSLETYVQQVQRQSIANMQVTHPELAKAFKGIVVKESILKQFGAAMNSGRAIFVYGPAGSGKSYISEHLVGLLTGDVAIPYAIVVDDAVIQVFDPLVHIPVTQTEANICLDGRRSCDARWVLCRRPVVSTGGELTLPMLDLDFDTSARFYQAPPQVKANNGLLIIDDLGRQMTPVLALLNRWIVPLDRRVDYLALHNGKKFMVPFDVIVVFSTNMPPRELADEAFLRRLGYKIYIGPLDEQDYREIARQVCAELEVPFSEAGINHLLHEHHYKEGKPLFACLPRDIIGQVKDIARYDGQPPEMSPELLDWAWSNYFARDYEDIKNLNYRQGEVR
ncbi:MAG: ATP-binding protein [Formivibrio sp.]|nr:ATP-binding protein [Formivibrio sp.]